MAGTTMLGAQLEDLGALEQRLRDAEDNARKASAQAEHFKREWHLRGDEVERLRQALESIRAYWNGDSNETTTLDAIRRAVETAAIALENTDAR